MDDPAILGGPPVRPDGPPDWPMAEPAVRASLEAAIADGSWGKYQGPAVPALEEALAAFQCVPHVLTCASGTLAGEAALRALGVRAGDEVILSAYDYEANFLNVHAIGARPVLVDVDPCNANLDPDRLEAAITPTTKAILVSHLHGGIVPMSRLREIADRHGIPVLEDAAQATGATVEGRRAGSWGDVGIVSFGGSKLLSAGRGGALFTSKPELLQRARLWLSRGIQQWAALSELQACVLLPQLSRLPERTAHRRKQVVLLHDQLGDVLGLTLFENSAADCEPAYYKVGFFLDADRFGLDRELFVKAMRAEGIAFDVGFRALQMGRGASRFRAAGSLEHAETAHARVVMLHHPVLSLGPEEVEKVALAVRKTYRNAERLRGS
ncbi:MAG: DegT/DnrJ/EryC1/StrS family aminotransferase [Planctomycetes bacterium]|nr:DegT/DnrJ/EryC1/StrS family aminotransferase [Planctomycetota bacterium]